MTDAEAAEFIRTFPTLSDLQTIGPDPEALSARLLGAPLKFLETHDESILIPAFSAVLLSLSARICRDDSAGNSMSRHYAELGVSMLGTLRRRMGTATNRSTAYRSAVGSLRDTLSDIDSFCQWFSEDV